MTWRNGNELSSGTANDEGAPIRPGTPSLPGLTDARGRQPASDRLNTADAGRLSTAIHGRLSTTNVLRLSTANAVRLSTAIEDPRVRGDATLSTHETLLCEIQ